MISVREIFMAQMAFKYRCWLTSWTLQFDFIVCYMEVLSEGPSWPCTSSINMICLTFLIVETFVSCKCNFHQVFFSRFCKLELDIKDVSPYCDLFFCWKFVKCYLHLPSPHLHSILETNSIPPLVSIFQFTQPKFNILKNSCPSSLILFAFINRLLAFYMLFPNASDVQQSWFHAVRRLSRFHIILSLNHFCASNINLKNDLLEMSWSLCICRNCHILATRNQGVCVQVSFGKSNLHFPFCVFFIIFDFNVSKRFLPFQRLNYLMAEL